MRSSSCRYAILLWLLKHVCIWCNVLTGAAAIRTKDFPLDLRPPSVLRALPSVQEAERAQSENVTLGRLQRAPRRVHSAVPLQHGKTTRIQRRLLAGVDISVLEDAAVHWIEQQVLQYLVSSMEGGALVHDSSDTSSANDTDSGALLRPVGSCTSDAADCVRTCDGHRRNGVEEHRMDHLQANLGTNAYRWQRLTRHFNSRRVGFQVS
jgi:hypothetical protein